MQELGTSSCDQYNAAAILANGGPNGRPPAGTVLIPLAACAKNRTNCIECRMPAGQQSPTNHIVGPGQSDKGIGQSHLQDCGTLWIGLCDNLIGSWECVDPNGQPAGVCASVTKYDDQPVAITGGP